jgi:hypothetical protein
VRHSPQAAMSKNSDVVYRPCPTKEIPALRLWLAVNRGEIQGCKITGHPRAASCAARASTRCRVTAKGVVA